MVAKKLRKLKDEKVQRDALKHNIQIRVVGFGWDQFKTNWTVLREDRPIHELASRLKEIIIFEKGKEIPLKPPTTVQDRRDIPVLGTITDDRRQLDAKHFKNKECLRKAALKLAGERRERGDKNSMYAFLQAFDAPTNNQLIGKRIDVLWPMRNEETRKTEKQWCQGKVLSKVKGNKREFVVAWDAMPDIEGFQEESESNVTLEESKYRRVDVQYAWRMDIDVELFENFYDDDDEDVIMNDDERPIPDEEEEEEDDDIDYIGDSDDEVNLSDTESEN